MQRPQFVDLAFRCLIADICFLLVLPFIGFPAFLGLLFYAPMMTAFGVEDGVKWLSQRCGTQNRWSLGSRSVCGGGLLFLLLTVGLVSWENPNTDDLWGFLGFLYLVILVMRFAGGGLVNVVFSLLCLLVGKGKLDRLNSVCSLLTNSAGLFLLYGLMTTPMARQPIITILEAGHSIHPAEFVVWTVLIALGFLYAAVWGIVVQWLSFKWRDDSDPET